jgi:hypothetical protein
MFNKMVLAFVPEQDIIAGVVSVNLMNQTASLKTDEGDLGEFSLNDIILLQEVGLVNGVERVFDKDVLEVYNGLVLVEVVERGEVVFHALDDKLEILESSEPTPHVQETLDEFDKDGISVVGSIFELEVEDDTFDFNVKVVKDFNGTFFSYFYALNNKAEQQIDLIAVSFVGDVQVEGTEHERRTISHEVFLDSLEAKTLVEVSEQEFSNFIIGVFGQEAPTLQDLDAMDYSEAREGQTQVNPVVENAEEQVKVPTCTFCDNPEEDCKCEPW